MLDWIKNHFNTLHNLQLNSLVTDLSGETLAIDDGFKHYIRCVNTMRHASGKLIFIGNGGSAGIASHLAIDYAQNGRIHALTLNDVSALTCLSNDYGYEYVFSKQIEFHARKEDVLIAISSSGKSPNILNAVAAARNIGCQVITFTGFEENNSLSRLGDLNFYIASKGYGFVEVAHLALGHAMLDYIIQERCQSNSIQQEILTAEVME
ncbi:MAG: SIS domain-containing protein [Gammaproteobacteria bacterium]|nr:SIS domain-containing protein [Gammaproteobacteria bacterium]